MIKNITYAASLDVPGRVYVDVRSPGEYREDHIPGSVNIPLFDDRERGEVGIIYRTAGRQTAIERGTGIVGTKLEALITEFGRFRESPIIINCARGGMRSGSVAALLDSLGYDIYRVIDGYKDYRRAVIRRLQAIDPGKPLFVIQGLTGSGKTEILRRMPNAIDLEQLAGHRSSVFGAIGLAQNTQKGFESGLLARIDELSDAPFLVVEAESRKIGNLHIPIAFFTIMKDSPAILVTTEMERRIDIIDEEYSCETDPSIIEGIVNSIEGKLGAETTKVLAGLIQAGDRKGFIRFLLEKYYDPLYSFSIMKRSYIAVIQNNNTLQSIEQINKHINIYLNDHK